MGKTALITGISGQDGSYLAEHLLRLGYRVVGLVRRHSSLLPHLAGILDRIELVSGDVRDYLSLDTAVRKTWPDEIYNLAGQAFVPTSWTSPSATLDVNTCGLARLLHLVEQVNPQIRVYQASSSEMFGDHAGACDETTPMRPQSPYGVSKLAAHRLASVYRDKGLYVACGILFNHESERRGPEMVTQKICRVVAEWAAGNPVSLHLGNTEARRDWGHARDYVKAMHLMLQRPQADDYVIGTGEAHSVMEFLTQAMAAVPALACQGLVSHDQRLARANDIQYLCANPDKARRELGWQAETSFPQLVAGMMAHALSRTEVTVEV